MSDRRVPGMDARIAVVGMACRFPGGAHDPEAFWKLLKDRICTMEDVPGTRYNIEDYWSRDGDEVNKMMARKGHFLTEGLCFDEAFFNLSPRQALNTDPQHRVLLETVVDALDDAGYRPEDEGGEAGWVRSRMGVFVGSSVDSYQNNLATNIDTFFCPGMIRGFASGRVSHHFKWQGPSIVYDSACASGLVAVHAACQSLLLRESDAALAAGVNMITSPEMTIGLSKGFFISNSGGCRTFDETGDGYCRAEGVATLVLKRLEDAIRDNDKIDAVILASGTNQSGPAESLTKPHSPTQAALFAGNCARAGISPLAVRAVEAHGTGTQAGDYAEMEAIKLAFTEGRPPAQANDDGSFSATPTSLFVSSLKPNIGHSESTSGIASLIKAALMMRHRQVAPHIGITTRRNPRLGAVEDHGIVIPLASAPLDPVEGQERVVVSVNNFGAPGGNANVLLQESQYAPGHARAHLAPDRRTHHIIALSGKPHTPFSSLVTRLLAHLDSHPDTDLASLSYSTTARRVDYPARVAFSVSSIADLRTQLAKSPAPVLQSKQGGGQGEGAVKVGFVLGGNGSQFAGMGRALYDSSPLFRTHIDACEAAHPGTGLLRVVQGELDPLAATSDPLAPTSDPLLRAPSDSSSSESDYNYNYETVLAGAAAIFAVGYALGMTWRAWGIEPALIVGHSMGEFAGLALAGALSLADAMKLVVAKARAICTEEIARVDGGMLAVGAPPARVAEWIGECFGGQGAEGGEGGVEVACYNGPAQTAVSGPKGALVKLKAYVSALPDPPLSKLLPGRFAWHSSHMAPATATMSAAALAGGITPTPATHRMLLNVRGALLDVGDTIARDYLAQQMVQPVRWDLCMQHGAAQDVDVWLELSAKSILLPLVRPFVPPGRTVTCLPSLNGPTTDSWSTLSKALARLYEAHAPVNWARYHADYAVRLVSLPRYPFARNEHYVPYRDRLFVANGGSGSTAAVGASSGAVETPLGTLEVRAPWAEYVLHASEALSVEGYIWLAASCTRGTSGVRDVRVSREVRRGERVSVVVDEGGGRVTFVGLASGTPVASCVVTSLELEEGGHAGGGGVGGRERLARDPSASVFTKKMVSKMLREPAERSAGVIVGPECDEGVSTVPFTPSSPSSTHTSLSLSSVPFTPVQLRSVLQSARMLLYLMGAPTHARDVGAFEFASASEWSAANVRAVNVHAVVGPDGEAAGVDAYLYADERDKPLARLRDYGRLDCTDDDKLPLTPVSQTQPVSSLSQPVESVVEVAPPDRFVLKTPPPEPKKEARLTQESMTALLASELGVPAYSVSAYDRLEDLGVDSIMSLLMRDKLSELHGARLTWFVWRKGLTVQDLWDYVALAAAVAQ